MSVADEGLAARMQTAVAVAMARKGIKSYAELGRLAGLQAKTCKRLSETTTVGTIRLIAAALGCDPGSLIGSPVAETCPHGHAPGYYCGFCGPPAGGERLRLPGDPGYLPRRDSPFGVDSWSANETRRVAKMQSLFPGEITDSGNFKAPGAAAPDVNRLRQLMAYLTSPGYASGTDNPGDQVERKWLSGEIARALGDDK